MSRASLESLASLESGHAQKVARVAGQLRDRTCGGHLSLRKRAVSHVVPKPNDLRHTDDKIDIADLDQILLIDPVRQICVAEAGVTFVDLVAATLPHGLVPMVVPELKTITVGGAVAGCSLESMSFRHGGFHDSCLEYEVVTAGGDVLTCTPHNEHALVFQMMHGAFGTLGILTKLTFQLVPAKPFVHVTYESYRTLDDYLAAIRSHAAWHGVDFMDGIIHGASELVLSVGRFVDGAPYTHRYDRWRTYWKSTATRRDDYLTTEQYLFRYDRGVTNVTPFLSSTTVLRLAQRFHRWLPAERPRVTLDTFVPLSRVPAFFDWYCREIAFFPIWCVPYRRVRDYEWIAPAFFDGLEDDLFLDLAVYGMKQPPGMNVHRKFEEQLARIGGLKTLISHNYYSPEEFWAVWNKDNYNAVKRVTDPRNLFRDLYAKTCRAAHGLPSPAQT
ncbi:MAG TPA: FAD-binding oxidoreductase [Kofleriaceae bacterium]|nr:FAD-binding oxidoreductase [Kofleriaceae bacterium]